MRFRLLHCLIALAAPPIAAAPVAVPPLHYIARTLPNGLRVYEMPDKGGTTVSVQVWYDVGSKDDPTGRSGFAHLFEHLMFKATRNMPAEMLDRLTEDVGGANNASTDDDYTEYHETAPGNHLERLIWAEAERMGSLVVDQANFTSEREVVKEELRGDFARPYGPLFAVDYPAANYRVHPYARPTIGSIADLDKATLDDVRAFHALYYRPDNAVLVVSGNFDPKQLDGWIDRYFAPIAKPTWPIPRIHTAEPARAGPSRYVIRAPNTPLPAVSISWLIPPAEDKDHAVLNMIDGILSGGESSRFYQDLVYRDQIASEADVNVDFKKEAGTLSAYAIVASGHTPQQIEAALRAEVARLRDRPVSPAELSRVRNLVVTSALKQRETAEGRASIVASGAIMERDPDTADRRLAAIQRVTPADIQRVARALLTDYRAVTIHYLAPTAFPADQGKPATLSPTIATAALVAPGGIPTVIALDAAERAQPPKPGAPVTPVVPVPVVRKLPNGMHLVVLTQHDLPLVTAHLVSPRGAADNPRDRAGLAELAGDVIDRGTATRNATQITGTIESLGGSINGDSTRDGSTVSLTVKSDELARAMPVFADVALHPAFAQREIDRARAETLDQIVQSLQNPGSLAGLVGARAVYGNGPYGAPENGTPASLRTITRPDLLTAYRAIWRPETTTLVMVGDVSVDQAYALAEKLFGAWRDDGPPLPAPVQAQPLPAPRLIVVDFPDTAQATVLVSRATIRRQDADYFPMLVANATLGGGYSSRLNREVRVKRGLAYGASSSFSAGRLPGQLNVVTQTKNESVPEVLSLLRSEMKRIGSEPAPADELAARKATLTGNFGDAIETTDGLAAVVAGMVEHRIDPASIAAYAGSVAAVSPMDVQRVAKALMDPGVASVVVVGDAKVFLPALRAQGLLPEVIPAGQIRLDSATLR